MQSVILYSQTSPSPDHQLLHISRKSGSVTLYVRSEVVDADLMEAMDMAKPREGETVLKTVELPGQNAKGQTTPTDPKP